MVNVFPVLFNWIVKLRVVFFIADIFMFAMVIFPIKLYLGQYILSLDVIDKKSCS